MSDNLHNANRALEYLEGKGIDTSRGRVFLARDVDDAMKLVRESDLDTALAPKPKTMAQAKRFIRQDEELMSQMKAGGQTTTDLGGGSIQAGPDPSSRT